MTRRIAILQGHPDPCGRHFGNALADVYADGACAAGHEVRCIEVAKLDFSLLRSSEDFYQGAHSLKSLARNILAFSGIGPIRTTLIGWLGGGAGEPEGAFPALLSTAQRKRWLDKLHALGRQDAEKTPASQFRLPHRSRANRRNATVDEFSYLSILISIVLGFAVTNLLTGMAALVRARANVKMYWPVPVWMITLFLILVQSWWAMFVLRTVGHWNFVGFFVVLAQPVLLYLSTALIVPIFSEHSPNDLRVDYYRHARWFFGVMAAQMCVSLAKDVVLYGQLPQRTNLAAHVVFFVMLAIGSSTRSELFHKTGAPVALALIIVYIASLFLTLD